jgi:IclR family transcriptional regulator, acetate operon repressor
MSGFPNGRPGRTTGDGQPVKSNPGGGNASEKVLTVLEALPDYERVTDIAEATGLPKSTVHRILRVLVDHQFALNVGGGRYLGGPRILSLSSKVLGRFEPAQYADAALRKLQQDTGYTVHLGLLVGDDVVYAAKVEGSKPYHMPSRLGMSIRLHCTAVGKAALSWTDEAEVREMLRRAGMERRTANTITDEDALIAELRTIRKRGYAFDMEENENGIVCLGAPVFDHAGRAVGGVSISTLTLEPWKEPVEELAATVIKVSEEISHSFGAPTTARH